MRRSYSLRDNDIRVVACWAEAAGRRHNARLHSGMFGFNSFFPAPKRVFVTHCNAMPICYAAMQICPPVQHAAYMFDLKWYSRTNGKKADVLIKFNNLGD